MFESPRVPIALLFSLLAGGWGCSDVLGIQDATCDPGFEGCPGHGTDGAPSTLCQQYCDAVMANCTGDYSVYLGADVCLSVCKALEPGTAGDQTGNTAQCRLTHARAVAETGEPNVDCPAAGPGGEGVCGDNCSGFCTIMVEYCPQYSDMQECSDVCAGVPELGGYSALLKDGSGAPLFGSGNSVECRLWHVSSATQLPATHCLHAAGESPCQ
jgi:hypothetical protein